MNFEETIRAKHAFEDRVHEFLDLASVMTEREIEIVLARLADALPGQTDAGRLQSLLKGKLLSTYLELRKTGEKTQRRKFRRLFGPEWKSLPQWKARERFNDYVVRCATEASVIPEGVTFDENAQTSQADMTKTVKLLAP
jgi:hypothetical protein